MGIVAITSVVMMLKAVVYLTLFRSLVYVRSAGGIGDGRWTVLDTKQCDQPEQYEMAFKCSRNKMNRTHDGFNAVIDLRKEIDEQNYAVEIDVYKEVDGGFKFYQKMTDQSFCNFSRKYAKGNMEKAFSMANIDPPDCPIKPGSYNIEGFIFNYAELPETSVYGVYEVHAFLIRDMHKVGCVSLVLEFKEYDDCDDYED